MEKVKEKELTEGQVTLKRIRPDLSRVEREMARMVEDVFVRPLGRSLFPLELSRRLSVLDVQEPHLPAIEIFEEKDDVVVKAELPGLKKEDLQINISDNLLTIRGEKKKEEELKEKGYYYSERSFGLIERSIDIPREIQNDKVRAVFTEGILEIRLPKTEAAKRTEVRIKVE